MGALAALAGLRFLIGAICGESIVAGTVGVSLHSVEALDNEGKARVPN